MKSKSLIFCIAALAGFAALNARDQIASKPATTSASAGAENNDGWSRHPYFGYFSEQWNLTDARKQPVKI
jgi:hypothetical protein